MERAFPDTQPLGDDVPHQARVARIRICRARADFEAIINIVVNWRPELNIGDMEKGTEQDNLNRFRQQNTRGNKLILQYSVTTVQLPGSAPQRVLRKLEEHVLSGEMRPGWIVVCNDCHKFSSHLGEERSWRAPPKGNISTSPKSSSSTTLRLAWCATRKISLPRLPRGVESPFKVPISVTASKLI
jgi:hypothetical protein